MNDRRFQSTPQGQQFPSEYDIPSGEIADLIARNPAAIYVETISLAQAGSKVIYQPGFGFVIYGFSTVDNSKYSEAYIGVSPDRSDTQEPTLLFPAKTGRGFYGSFSKLALTWPADPNASTNSAYFVIFKSRKMPWIGGLEST